MSKHEMNSLGSVKKSHVISHFLLHSNFFQYCIADPISYLYQTILSYSVSVKSVAVSLPSYLNTINC